MIYCIQIYAWIFSMWLQGSERSYSVHEKLVYNSLHLWMAIVVAVVMYVTWLYTHLALAENGVGPKTAILIGKMTIKHYNLLLPYVQTASFVNFRATVMLSFWKI